MNNEPPDPKSPTEDLKQSRIQKKEDEDREQSRNALFAIGALVFVISLVWLFFEPGFEPVLGILGGVAGMSQYLLKKHFIPLAIVSAFLSGLGIMAAFLGNNETSLALPTVIAEDASNAVSLIEDTFENPAPAPTERISPTHTIAPPTETAVSPSPTASNTPTPTSTSTPAPLTQRVINYEQILAFEAERFSNISWSPNEDFIATSGFDGVVRIWDTVEGVQVTPLVGHESAVQDIAWSRTGNRIASSDDQGNIIVWSAEDFSIITDELTGYHVAFSHDGQFIAARNEDGSISVYESKFWNHVKTSPAINSRILDVQWSPDNEMVAFVARDSNVYLWKIRNDELIVLEGHSGNDVRGLAWSPNGVFLATGASDDDIIIWEVEREREFIRWRVPAIRDDLVGKMINSLAWSEDGMVLASSGWSDEITLRNAKTGMVIQTFEASSEAVYSIQWSTHDVLASAGNGRVLQIWAEPTE